MSAFLHWALVEAAFLAGELGDREWRKRLLSSADEVMAAFKRTLWNSQRRLFRDGVPFARKAPTGSQFMPADRDIETYTPHTNIAAVVGGIVEGEEARKLMRQVMEDKTLIEPQPYFHHFTFLALERTGLFEEYGVKLMASWRKMLDGGMTTWREAWDQGDWSHAWTSTPTLQLMRNVLGVKILSPGCGEVEVSPRLGPLNFAEGTIPFPQGDAQIRVERKDGEIERIIKLPDGVKLAKIKN
jgi:alpha-L-rhamnosidase